MNWKLTQASTGEPEIDTFREDPEEDLSLGFSLLRALAESDETMVEIEPGVWRINKAPEDFGRLV
jgi:hypothetical protein